MNTPEPDGLEQVAESLADSRELDWAALARAHPGLLGTLERLRALEQLAAAHREARAESAGPGEAGAFAWGPLRVHERLGQGAFGEVFRAHDASLGRDVALKLRRADATGPAGAWLAEARRLARVSHPNVLAVLGVGEHDGRAGLWTELVRGETLEARLAREGPLPPSEVVHVGMDLCRALAALHAQRLVHGDVKTANVMCERGPGARHPGRIVLMDLGAGQDVPAASPALWTPLVSAPELLEGGEASAASDQYALGVLLYRLLTARWPHEADNMPDLLERTARAEPPPLRELRPDLPLALHDAVLRALARSPSARHANLSAFERSLAAALEPAAARPAPRRGLVAGAALALAAIAVAAVLATRGSRPAARAAAPVAPIAPAADRGGARALEVSATLLRRTSTGSEPLVDGGVVRAGDRLALALRASEPVWVYVLDQDASGAAFALFPRAGLESRNPLAPGEEHRLPGRLNGRDFAWRVDAGGGSETFVVVASRAALPELEALVQALSAATAGPGGARPARAADASPLRGVEGVVDDSPAPAADGPVTRLAERLERARDPGVWLWRVHATHARP